ncbi:FAD-dependent oxidoreductase [Modestobacter lapidis]|nr:FAD-binding monooxygenase [Modestobacter lapidis]
MDQRLGRRAVVLGASMAGLLAARVLADAYAEVTVLDRDDLPAGARARRGVPQGRHIHALVARGQQELEELLPGLTGELAGQGVPVMDAQRDVRWFMSGHRLAQGPASGLRAASASRPLLEAQVRARVRALPGVTVTGCVTATGLTATADGSRVTGVRVLPRAEGGAEQVLPADLVVDATGRGSRVEGWLAALGHPRPATERVAIGLHYATRSYRLRPGALGDDLAVLAAPTPAHPRGAALAVVEGGRCLVTLAGVLGDRPPTDPDGFLAFARSLHCRDVHEAVRDAEPLDEAVAFHFPASVRRRYERLPRFPAGLLVIGDAVCSFNPLYAQGMSVAALEAQVLRRHLRRGAAPEAGRFLADIARVIDVPWDIAVGGDLAFPAVEGRRTPRVRLLNAYVPRLHAAAADDATLARAFVGVTGLVDHPATLLRPGVAARVVRHAVRAALRPAGPGPVRGVAPDDDAG